MPVTRWSRMKLSISTCSLQRTFKRLSILLVQIRRDAKLIKRYADTNQFRHFLARNLRRDPFELSNVVREQRRRVAFKNRVRAAADHFENPVL